MVSEEPVRKIVREFKDAGWTPGKSSGSHEKWHCPTGRHSAELVVGHRIMSPGVVRKVRNDLAACDCKPEER